MADFQSDRAWLKGPDFFQRFVVEGPGEPLSESDLDPTLELIVIERGGQHAAFLMRELSHPHGAQGMLAGLPYLVSF